MKVNITPTAKTEWLVIFLVLDTGEMDSYLSDFFDGLKATKLRKTHRIYFLKDSIQRIKNPRIVPFGLELSEFFFNEETGETDRRRVDIDGVDVNDGMAWLEATRQIYTLSNAMFSALITWSHGSGLGIGNQLVKIHEREFNLVRSFKGRYGYPDIGKLTCTGLEEFENALRIKRDPSKVNCPAVEQLFISEIGKGLEDVTGRKRFDMMIMCNCRNHVIDNSYNLNKVTEYYFAALAGVQIVGYDFAGFVDYINGTSPKTFIQRAVHILTRYFLQAGNSPLRKFFYRAYFRKIIRQLFAGYKKLVPLQQRGEALVATKLDRTAQFPGLIDPICNYFMKNRDTVYPVIIKVIKEKVRSLPGVELYDAITVFRLIAAEIRSRELDRYTNRFVGFILRNVFVDKMVGEDLLNKNPPYGINCFTLYIPTDLTQDLLQALECQYLQEYLRSPFVVDTKWDDFMRDFIEWQKQQQGQKTEKTGFS